jgi:hypothetical protein
MKLKIKCPKNSKHQIVANEENIYCSDCDDYLENDLIFELVQNALNEGKIRGKQEVRTALGI